MFVALRDLRHARGRFALMTAVVVLITFLVTFLASLTAGLARESTSAITSLPSDHLAFSMPRADDSPEFTASRVDADQWQQWARTPGVVAATPLGVATTRAETGSTTASVTAFGVPPGSGLLPTDADVAPGKIVLTSAAADQLDATAGDVVTLGGADLTVADRTAPEASFAHTPAVWTTLGDWQPVGARGADDVVATVVALATDGDHDGALSATDADLGTTTVTTEQARSAVASYAGENASLTTMQVFLLAISALVVGAFFTVWTISRSADIAVLKALGASTRYLQRDALGQAAVVLVVGVGLGTALTAGGGLLLPDTVPVLIDATTTLLPATGLIVLGLAGAAVSIARITRIDPHAALAAH